MDKVKWEDIPTEHCWLLRTWGNHHLRAKTLAELMCNKGDVSVKQVKESLAWFGSRALHVFTHYEANADGYKARYRVTKKPLIDVVYSYGKKGLASQVQSNRFYLHSDMSGDGLATLTKAVFAELPTVKVATQEAKERQYVDRMKHLFSLMQGCITNTDDALEKDVVAMLTNSIMHTTHLSRILPYMSSGQKRILFGKMENGVLVMPPSPDYDDLASQKEIAQRCKLFVSTGSTHEFETDEDGNILVDSPTYVTKLKEDARLAYLSLVGQLTDLVMNINALRARRERLLAFVMGMETQGDDTDE